MTPATCSGGSIYASAIEGMTGIAADTGCLPSLEDVARTIGTTPKRLRTYFPTDDAMVAAMAENAMLLLHHILVDVVAKVDPDDPVEQMVALADAYVEWGFRYPREFRIIGQMPASAFQSNPQLVRYERALHELMLRIMNRAREASASDGAVDMQSFLSIAHTYAYGVVSKMLLGDLARWNPGLTDREAARCNLRVFIHQFMRGARPPVAGRA